MLHKKILLCIYTISFFITLPMGAMEAPNNPPKALSPLDKALFDAIYTKKGLGEIRQLIAQGANLNVQRIHGKQTPLYNAIEHGNNIEIINALITPENINLGSITGSTPLHIAAQKNNLKAVHLLIQKGAHKNALDKWGETALQSAIREKTDITVVKELITPENINIPINNAFHRTTLGQALEEQYSAEVITLLIESGAEITEQILKDYSALLTWLATQITPEDVQHIIPGILALKETSKNTRLALNRDVQTLLKNQIIKDVLDEKLALARKYQLKATDKELTDLILANIRRELSKKKVIQ